MENLHNINDTLSSIIDKLLSITDEHSQMEYGLKHFNVLENNVRCNFENANTITKAALIELKRLKDDMSMQLYKNER